MKHRTSVIIVSSASFVAVMMVVFAVAIRHQRNRSAVTQARPFKLDFSKNPRTATQMGWPAAVKGSEWDVQEELLIDLDGGSMGRITLPAYRMTAYKRPNGRFLGVRILMPEMSVDEVSAWATGLARTFGTEIDGEVALFIKERNTRPGGRSWVGYLHETAERLVIVEIRPSYAGVERPWYLTIRVSFPPVDNAEAGWSGLANKWR